MGMWGRRDPAGYAESANILGYSSACPLSRVDPTGQLSKVGLGCEPVPCWGTFYEYSISSKNVKIVSMSLACANCAADLQRLLSRALMHECVRALDTLPELVRPECPNPRMCVCPETRVVDSDTFPCPRSYACHDLTIYGCAGCEVCAVSRGGVVRLMTFSGRCEFFPYAMN